MAWGMMILDLGRVVVIAAMFVFLLFAFKWWMPAILERKADDPASIELAKKSGIKLGLTGITLNAIFILLTQL